MAAIHPRSDWTDTPAADANPLDQSLVRGTAVHWNGPAVPLSAFTDPRSYLEGVRRFHVNVRRWSDIAYSDAVDQEGELWELRGLDHMSAANGDTFTNQRWYALLCIVGVGQRPTPAMKAGIERAVDRHRRHNSRAQAVTTHSAIRPEPTACPGELLITFVGANDWKAPGDDPTLDASNVARAARNEGAVKGGRRLKRALAGEVGPRGMDLDDWTLGGPFRDAYRVWQKSLGYTGADANGIPGEQSLTKLGRRSDLYPFTVEP